MGLFDLFRHRKGNPSENNQKDSDFLFPGRDGISDTPLNEKYTPDKIEYLGKRDIFVFGSNLAGKHAGGAARIALNRFGAIWGQGEGLQGNSYAIPTMQGGVETIKPYVDKFIEFAEYEKALTFYVTKIGCGTAGFDVKDIAPLFRNAYFLNNVILPIEFVDFIEKETCSIHPQRILDTIETTHEDRVKHLTSPIKVIGIGGGGTNSVERMFETPLENVEYAVLNTDSAVAQSNLKNRFLFEGETDSPCGIIPHGFTNEWFKRYYDTNYNHSMANEIIDKSAKQVIIVTGFGGVTGVLGSNWLIEICKSKNVPVMVVCTIPFDFEGKRKQERAIHAAEELLNKGIEINKLYAEDLNSKYDMSFFDCFSFLDGYVADTVHKICMKLTSDEVKSAKASEVQIENKETGSSTVELTTHCYGMTRTFTDLIICWNEEKHYDNPNQALSDLGEFINCRRGYPQARLAIRVLNCVLHDNPEIFEEGRLNESRLRELIFDEDRYIGEYEKAYHLYCREKLMNLIVYLNEFRRYTSPEELRHDLFESSDVLKFTAACGPNPGFEYFVMSGATGMNYPVQFFVSAIRKFWPDITTNGILDADKMKAMIYGNHEDSIKAIGLQATIDRDFIEDSPCHPEVYVPKVMGSAPIYVKRAAGNYIRSCGEGKGPNAIPDWLEFQIAKQILVNDKEYKLIGSFYIPKYDNTLPVYEEYSGRLVFKTQSAKLQFIEDVKRGRRPWR